MGHLIVRNIHARIDDVWTKLIDVERWPDWTESMTSVQRLDEGPFGLGSRAKVRQPRLIAQTWRVTEFAGPSEFTWEAHGPGITTVAGHRLQSEADGVTSLTLTAEQHGPLAVLLRPVISGLVERYITMEAEGLKQACESGPR